MWAAVSKIAAIYSEITAVCAGATTANTFLGRAVLSLVPAYQQTMASATLAATVQEGANRAAAAGAYRLANQILYCSQEYIALGISAKEAGAMQLQAASLAAAGNFKLAQATLLQQGAHVKAAAAAADAGRATIIAGSGAMATVKSLTQAVWALAGGWIGVAAAVGYGLYKLTEFASARDQMEKAEDRASKRIRTQNYSSMHFSSENDLPVNAIAAQNKQKQKSSYWEEYVRQAKIQDKNDRKNYEEEDLKNRLEELRKPNLNLKFPHAPELENQGKKVENVYEEGEKLKDKIADMLSQLQGKLLEETGSTAEVGAEKIKAEVENMKRELDKNKQDFERHGLSIKPIQDKMVEYQQVMAEKIKRTWRDAWTDLKNQTGLINAQLLGDKKAMAEAEYMIELQKIEKERRQREKDLQLTKNDLEAKAVAQQEAAVKILLADQQKNNKIKDAIYDRYQAEIEHAAKLVNLEGKAQGEIDALRKASLANYIDSLNAELATKGLIEQRKFELEKRLNAAINEQRQIDGRNLNAAAAEAMKRLKEQQFDYAQVMVETYNSMYSDIENHLNQMLEGTESLSEGVKGIFGDMLTDIEKMMVKMWMKQTIMQPLQNWWGNILGSTYGSKNIGAQFTINTDWTSDWKKYFPSLTLAREKSAWNP